MNSLSFLFLLFFFILGCDSDLLSSSQDCDGDNCTSESRGTGSESASSQSSIGSGESPSGSRTISSNSESGSSSNASSNSSSSGISTGISTGSGGFANSGNSSGATDVRSGNNSSPSIIEYKSPGGYSHYFAKINEPIDLQTSEKLPLALKFVAVGKLPLKYSWFKEEAGATRQISSEGSVFSKDKASLSDSGTYFAKVEDADGNSLTSRKAIIKVNPERKECLAGEYGPEKFDSESQTYDYSYLVPRAQMSRTTKASFFDLEKEIDGYAISINRCIKYYGSGSDCKLGQTLLQCQNGIYNIVSTTCRCYN